MPSQKLDYRGGKLQQFVLLPADDLFALLLIKLGGQQRQLIQKHRGLPECTAGNGFRAVFTEPPLNRLKQRLLQRQHKCRRLRGREALARARP